MGAHCCSGNCRRFRVFKASTDGLCYCRYAACSRPEDRDIDFSVWSQYCQGNNSVIHTTTDLSLCICPAIIVSFNSDAKFRRPWIRGNFYSTCHSVDSHRRQGWKARGQEHFCPAASFSCCLEDRKSVV